MAVASPGTSEKYSASEQVCNALRNGHWPGDNFRAGVSAGCSNTWAMGSWCILVIRKPTRTTQRGLCERALSWLLLYVL